MEDVPPTYAHTTSQKSRFLIEHVVGHGTNFGHQPQLAPAGSVAWDTRADSQRQAQKKGWMMVPYTTTFLNDVDHGTTLGPSFRTLRVPTKLSWGPGCQIYYSFTEWIGLYIHFDQTNH